MIDLDLHPSRRTLFQFGFVAVAAFGFLGALMLWKRSIFGLELGGAATALAYALWGVGILSGCLSLVAPQVNRYLYVGLTLLTFPVGFVLSHLLLAVLFYGVITPVGTVMRFMGRDPLHRKFDRNRASYWVDHAEPKSVEDYFRQY